jgi:hypothetical protein
MLLILAEKLRDSCSVILNNTARLEAQPALSYLAYNTVRYIVFLPEHPKNLIVLKELYKALQIA